MAQYAPPDGRRRDELLNAPYAMASHRSRGRRHAERHDDPYRPIFQRDRERIVHARSFRRLMHKTQVLAVQTNDHHRTRLTHSLEVAQVSRTIARHLGLHEDLIEAIALSHDLGHPPFGHAGEAVLDVCLGDHGGFDHNLHALRIVEHLETPYPSFRGLNLSFEVRAAIAYHSGRPDHPVCQEYMDGEPLLEAAVVDLADSLAYLSADLDDALAIGLVKLDEVRRLSAWRAATELARQRFPDAAERPAIVRALLEWQVLDLTGESLRRLTAAAPPSAEAARSLPNLIGFSEPVAQSRLELREFLYERVYRHPQVEAMADAGQDCLRRMFDHLCRRPEDLPPAFRDRVDADGTARVVGDYIAGMTDRFARQECLRLCPAPSVIR